MGFWRHFNTEMITLIGTAILTFPQQGSALAVHSRRWGRKRSLSPPARWSRRCDPAPASSFWSVPIRIMSEPLSLFSYLANISLHDVFFSWSSNLVVIRWKISSFKKILYRWINMKICSTVSSSSKVELLKEKFDYGIFHLTLTWQLYDFYKYSNYSVLVDFWRKNLNGGSIHLLPIHHKCNLMILFFDPSNSLSVEPPPSRDRNIFRQMTIYVFSFGQKTEHRGRQRVECFQLLIRILKIYSQVRTKIFP